MLDQEKVAQFCKSRRIIESFGGNIEEMHETVFSRIGRHTSRSKSSNSFEALVKLAMFKLFSKRDIL
jgi:tRNA 2-selenouridine synthase SelU